MTTDPLTIAQRLNHRAAAKYLGIGTTKLYQLARTKKIAHYIFGNRRRYSVESLEQFLQDSQQEQEHKRVA